MFTPFPYLNFYYKYIGLIICIVGLGMMLVPTGFEQYNEWILLAGLFIVSYSKDRSKDKESYKVYRYNSFRLSFVIIFLMMLVITINNIINQRSNEINIILFGIIYLALFNIIYYIHVLFRLNQTETDQDISENYSRNKTLYIITYLVAALFIILALLTLSTR